MMDLPQLGTLRARNGISLTLEIESIGRRRRRRARIVEFS